MHTLWKGWKIMSSKKFKIGIIGFGGIGEQHLLNFRHFASAISVEVVCDRDENRLRRAKEEFRVPYLVTFLLRRKLVRIKEYTPSFLLWHSISGKEEEVVLGDA